MSGKSQGNDLDLSTIRSGADDAAASGIAHAELLVRFADAVVAHDEAALSQLRGPIEAALGPAGLLEAATVAANFQRMVRIADGTGIPQEAPVLTLGGDVIEELELRDFHSAANTPESGALITVLGKLVRPVVPHLVGWFTRRRAR